MKGRRDRRAIFAVGIRLKGNGISARDAEGADLFGDRKKLKCDRQKPQCSMCILYNSACTHLAARRRKAAKPKDATSIGPLHSSTRRSKQPPKPNLASLGGSGHVVEVSYREESGRHLPPSTEVLPIVEQFLTDFNSSMPLLNPEELLEIVMDWYKWPGLRESSAWAVINVVLALVHCSNGSYSPHQAQTANSYLENAQSALSEIISGAVDLRTVQVPLGLAILFMTAGNIQAALILVATALRSAHRIGLHRRHASAHLSAGETLQRNRVFWIAYILERELSTHARVAPIQLDSDIDIDLPPLAPLEDLTGFVFTPDNDAAINILRARVELARIQGMVYQHVFSASADHLNSFERAIGTSKILREIDSWTARVPPEFLPASLLHSPRSANAPRDLCMVYAVRLSCRALASYGNVKDFFHFSEWMRRVRDYSTTDSSATGLPNIPVSHGWQTLVRESYEFLTLFDTIEPKDDFFLSWTSCAYLTGLVCLLSNRVFDRSLESVVFEESIAQALAFAEKMNLEGPDFEKARMLQSAIRELDFYSTVMSHRVVVEDMRVSGWMEPNVVRN